MTDRIQGSPDSEGQFYQHISHLVDQSATGRLNRARKAQKDLLREVNNYPFYDLVLSVFEQTQRILLQAKTPTAVNQVLLFLGQFALAVQADCIDKGGKTIQLNDRTKRTVAAIAQNDGEVQSRPFIVRRLPQTYISSVNIAVGPLHEAINLGHNAFHLLYAKKFETDAERNQVQASVNKHNDWINNFRTLNPEFSLYTHGAEGDKKRDAFIDFLKTEPPHYLTGTRLIDKEFAGTSIEAVEKQAYPATPEDLDGITDYLAEALVSKDMTMNDRVLLEELLFYPTSFLRETPHQYQNRELLGKLALWQKRFIEQLLSRDPSKESQIKTIISGISEATAAYLLEAIFMWTVYPWEVDPDAKEMNDQARQPSYFSQNKALEWYREIHPEESFLLRDKVGTDFYLTVVLPYMEELADNLGAGDKFLKVIEIERSMRTDFSFEKTHVKWLKKIFEKNCGEEFLTKLNNHAQDIHDLTRSAWQSTMDQGVHFLPMNAGLNVIEFTPDSVGNILGLEKVIVRRTGSVLDWKIDFLFDFLGTDVATVGTLNQQGELILSSPIDTEIPGLHMMLNHIGVLVSHDLVVQNNAETKQARGVVIPESGDAEGAITDDGNPVINVEPKADDDSDDAHSSEGGPLPRVQTDKDLIRDVYKYTGFTPRVVEIHRRWMSGHQEYRAAVELYNEAVENNTSELAMEWIRKELEDARANARKASAAKVSNIPARFELEHITDPVTQEVRYLRTWVIEHTSPKPTDEELRSPIKLYERYYKKSSALASLDQMKPWFVGA